MRNECRRGFYHTGASYYGKVVLAGSKDLDRISVGLYPLGGGTLGEFCFAWRTLGSKTCIRLDVWDDAWIALQAFSDVLAKLAGMSGEHLSPEQFCELLVSCGVEDLTQRKAPHPHRAKGLT